MNKKNHRITSSHIGSFAMNLIVWLGGVLMLLPFLWMVSSSFKTTEEIFQPATFFPKGLSMFNYQQLFHTWPFSRWILNSLFAALLTTVVALFITSLAGFAFAKYRFKGKQKLFTGLLLSTMIPFPILVVPLFVIISRLGLTNSIISLVLPFIAPPIGIFLMNQYAEYVPNALLDSARIDGAGELRIFFQIALPIMKPGLASLGIITFINSWNNFLWPLIAIRKEIAMTLPIGMANMLTGVSAGSAPPYGPAMAASTLVCIPTVAIFLAVQKYYIKGLTAGAVK
ncbi:carbohydrate ABC transporter permease [uncultured Sphaerochaeta sp.]|uniref:carbohydrate ABC transporter permease n=1 Tax=uncultured Sphaerochaeta sp. TaxID=886478 RepID=UPI002A0A26B4|nr:carbohydrate ABC transporter permease [uncultured Sphaerochaeta sp.]